MTWAMKWKVKTTRSQSLLWLWPISRDVCDNNIKSHVTVIQDIVPLCVLNAWRGGKKSKKNEALETRPKKMKETLQARPKKVKVTSEKVRRKKWERPCWAGRVFSDSNLVFLRERGSWVWDRLSCLSFPASSLKSQHTVHLPADL
jgi:hypothetical protein